MERRKQPRYTTARNSRRVVYKYYYLSDDKRMAVLGGRCHSCGKITDAFCDKCSRFVCENHMFKPREDDFECFCLGCKEKEGLFLSKV